MRRPSPDLLETVYLMQRRQAWLREFLLEEGEAPLALIGSATIQDNAATVAQKIRATLGAPDGWASHERTWSEASVYLRQRIEEIGVLIVINGIVGKQCLRNSPNPVSEGSRLQRQLCTHNFHKWTGFQGRADVHARPRTGTFVDW